MEAPDCKHWHLFQGGLDLVRQGSGKYSGSSGMVLDRSSSVPVQSNQCLPSSSMTTARSLDRQTSLGET